MSAKERPPSFQFYPRDLLSSTAYTLMTPEQRGGYLSLLCHAWLQPRPGWLPDDPDGLATLSGLAERWSECRTAIARAFRIRKGWWVQPRMVQERRAQQRRHFQAKKGARVTNKIRWGSVAQRPDSESRFVSPASASASAVEEDSKERKAPTGPSARCLARCQERFPNLDIPVIEAKLMAYHETNPFKRLDVAMINWCKSAEQRGIDQKRSTRMTLDEWAKS